MTTAWRWRLTCCAWRAEAKAGVDLAETRGEVDRALRVRRRLMRTLAAWSLLTAETCAKSRT